LQELRIAGLRALADLGGTFLEVSGKVVLRHTRRFSDFANQLTPMLDLDEAALRVHHRDRADLWEQVEGISLNRDRILLLIPTEEPQPIGNPELRTPGNSVRIKLFCAGIEVTGFIRIPLHSTMAGFLHQTTTRFLAVTQARLVPTDGRLWLESSELVHDFCLVNRALIMACIEARPLMM
jgi:hypothetical protein